ncbi:MAG: glutathione S-transferase family protein [Pseudomonadota bacterium]
MAPKHDLTLIIFPQRFGCRNPSPFCVKAEILLKMSGLPFRIERETNPGVGPLGKLPALRDGKRLIGDSELIRQYLATHYQVEFDRGLSARDRAAAHAFARMLEERTYWAIVHSRWIDEGNWVNLKKAYFSTMPGLLRRIFPSLIRARVRRDLKGQGLGRHDPQSIEAFALDDLKAVADWLGDKPFMLGDRPTTLDATVYGMVVSFIQPGFETPIRDMIMTDMRLAGYLARCDQLWFDEAAVTTPQPVCGETAMAA